MLMLRREMIIFITVTLFFSGLGGAYWFGTLQNRDKSSHTISTLEEKNSLLEEHIEVLKNPEYTIGIIYPMSGRLDWWAADVEPIISAAKIDLQSMLDSINSTTKFNVLFADSKLTNEGALEAVKSLIAQGAQIIVGLPTSGEVGAILNYVNAARIPVISPTSTASDLSKPDCVFRLSTPENYRARIGAEFALELNYTNVIVIHRNDDWGNLYADTISEVFQEKELPVHTISFEPSHTFYMNYSSEVKELETLTLGKEEKSLIFLVAWENEDYSILYEARKSPILSGIRWITAALYPSLKERTTMFGMAEDLRDFSLVIELWAPEQRPIVNDLTIKLMGEAHSILGHYPSYEHIYIYDTIMIAARTFLITGNGEKEALITAVPYVAENHFGITGHKVLDMNGDLQIEDTAFIGVIKNNNTYEFGYYAFHNGIRSEFSILTEPQERWWFFCPQC